MPGRDDVLVASPCSGHGFKFSCLIGRALADLATTGETDLAIDAWRIDPTHTPASVRTSLLANSGGQATPRQT